MNYTLDLGASAQQNLHRLAAGQIDGALRALDEGLRGMGKTPPARAELHEGVHEARKRIKKLRGLLRLLRKPLGKSAFARENTYFREVARGLSELRDATALIEALDALEAAEPELPGATLAELRQALIARRHRSFSEDEIILEIVRRADAKLRAGRQRVAAWTLAREDLAAIAPGFARSYRQARRAMRAALKRDDDELRHEWRKRAKYHLYHVRLVEPLAPGWARKRRLRLESLSDALGEERDLAQLATWLEEAGAEVPGQRAIASAIDRQRKGKRLRAEVVGARLFEGGAKKLRKRVAKGLSRQRAFAV
jgi:CHAD domain-containing protein